MMLRLGFVLAIRWYSRIEESQSLDLSFYCFPWGLIYMDTCGLSSAERQLQDRSRQAVASYSVTATPCCLRRKAAVSPVIPPPMMATELI